MFHPGDPFHVPAQPLDHGYDFRHSVLNPPPVRFVGMVDVVIIFEEGSLSKVQRRDKTVLVRDAILFRDALELTNDLID